MIDHYILIDRKPQPIDVSDKAMLIKWAQWWEDPKNRKVAQSSVGSFRISTIFLGLDLSFGGPVPVLFETMVFNRDMRVWLECFDRSVAKEVDAMTRRHCTWHEAVGYHKGCVKRLRIVMRSIRRAHAVEIRKRVKK